jgi:hypothetical protein
MYFGDIDTTPVDIWLVCPTCGKQRFESTIAERLGKEIRPFVFLDETECRDCLENENV